MSHLDEFPKIKIVKCQACNSTTEHHNPLCRSCVEKVNKSFDELDLITLSYNEHILLRAMARHFKICKSHNTQVIGRALEQLSELRF